MIKIHPLFFVLGILLFFQGYISLFAVYLFSLLWHEAGHLAAIKICGLHVERCTLFPFGGEIKMKQTFTSTPRQRLFIAFGGPIATIGLLIACLFIEHPLIGDIIKINSFLLLINLLPIWPLDGGRIIVATCEMIWKHETIYNGFITYSFFTLLFACIITVFYLPHSAFLLLNSLLLMEQVFTQWRFRKYYIALEKNINRQLT